MTVSTTEQFDTQAPQLTVRETVEFSAKLRLDERDPIVTPEHVSKFVDQALAMLELTNIEDLQVGSDVAGGLSFEQSKRLSIAIEMVANPSILFLDEPTSGLVSACSCDMFLSCPQEVRFLTNCCFVVFPGCSSGCNCYAWYETNCQIRASGVCNDTSALNCRV